jgi:hypothetical protein
MNVNMNMNMKNSHKLTSNQHVPSTEDGQSQEDVHVLFMNVDIYMKYVQYAGKSCTCSCTSIST